MTRPALHIASPAAESRRGDETLHGFPSESPEEVTGIDETSRIGREIRLASDSKKRKELFDSLAKLATNKRDGVISVLIGLMWGKNVPEVAKEEVRELAMRGIVSVYGKKKGEAEIRKLMKSGEEDVTGVRVAFQKVFSGQTIIIKLDEDACIPRKRQDSIAPEGNRSAMHPEALGRTDDGAEIIEKIRAGICMPRDSAQSDVHSGPMQAALSLGEESFANLFGEEDAKDNVDGEEPQMSTQEEEPQMSAQEIAQLMSMHPLKLANLDPKDGERQRFLGLVKALNRRIEQMDTKEQIPSEQIRWLSLYNITENPGTNLPHLSTVAHIKAALNEICKDNMEDALLNLISENLNRAKNNLPSPREKRKVTLHLIKIMGELKQTQLKEIGELKVGDKPRGTSRLAVLTNLCEMALCETEDSKLKKAIMKSIARLLNDQGMALFSQALTPVIQQHEDEILPDLVGGKIKKKPLNLIKAKLESPAEEMLYRMIMQRLDEKILQTLSKLENSELAKMAEEELEGRQEITVPELAFPITGITKRSVGPGIPQASKTDSLPRRREREVTRPIDELEGTNVPKGSAVRKKVIDPDAKSYVPESTSPEADSPQQFIKTAQTGLTVPMPAATGENIPVGRTPPKGGTTAVRAAIPANRHGVPTRMVRTGTTINPSATPPDPRDVTALLSEAAYREPGAPRHPNGQTGRTVPTPAARPVPAPQAPTPWQVSEPQAPNVNEQESKPAEPDKIAPETRGSNGGWFSRWLRRK